MKKKESDFKEIHEEAIEKTQVQFQTAENIYFNEKAYIDKTRVKPGEDAYAKNKFNQAASDDIPSNRDIPDARNYGYEKSCHLIRMFFF